MSRKNFLIIFAVFIFLIALGNVSANDIDDNLDNLTDTSDDIVLSSESSNDILTADESFNSLQSLIDSKGNGSTIDLNTNYTYSSDDSINGIRIDKTLTINGNGHSIDGAGVARIFNITGDGVILNNLIIKNGFINNNALYINSQNENINITIGNGAGILWSGANGILNQTQIINNTINTQLTIYNTNDYNVNYTIGNGAGVYWNGDNATILNSIFNNNKIEYNIIYQNNYYSNGNVLRTVANGAGLYSQGNTITIRKSQFTQNTVSGNLDDIGENSESLNSEQSSVLNIFGNAGAILVANTESTITDSIFQYNIGENYAGATYIRSSNSKITNCNFSHNNAQLGAAISAVNQNNGGSVITVDNSNFFNNTAIFGGAIYNQFTDSIVSNSNFTNNHANNGGAIQWDGAYGTIENSKFTNNAAKKSGAVSWGGNYGNILQSQFTNNTALSCNDIMGVSSTLTLSNNNFTGKYLVISDKITKGYEYVTIKNNYQKESIFVSVIVDNKLYTNVLLSSNAVEKIYLNDLDYSITHHTVNLIFKNKDNNVYNNIESEFDIITGSSVLYVNSVGGSDGSREDRPCTWNEALDKIPAGGTIYLLSETYDNIIDYNIEKPVSIIGLGQTTINGNHNKIFTITADNVTLKNIKFTNAYNSWNYNDFLGSGGAISIIGDNNYIINCTFTDNYVDHKYSGSSAGGAVHVRGNNTHVVSCEFSNNYAPNNGGALFAYISGGSSKFISIIDSKFTSNHIAGEFGGAVALYMNFELINSTFVNNYVGRSSGTLYINNAGNSFINNCTFKNNTGGRLGGAIRTESNLVINNSRFINNSANAANDIWRQAGTLTLNNNIFIGEYIRLTYNETTAKLNLNRFNYIQEDTVLKFIMNNDTTNPFFYIIPAQSFLNSYSFDFNNNLIEGKNTIKITASQIYNNNTYVISDIEFEYSKKETTYYVSVDGTSTGDGSKNHPYDFTTALDKIPYGGTIILLDGRYKNILNQEIYKSITITGSLNTEIDGLNTSNIIRVFANGVVIKNITFINGVATPDGETDKGSGGAITLVGDNNIVSNCKFTNNKGGVGWSYGAAIHSMGANNTIENCVFENNYAQNYATIMSYRNGGYGTLDVLVTVRDCNFTNNHASGSYGGAACFYTQFNLVNCRFDNNYANDNGGAVYWTNYGGNITNCIFNNNYVRNGDGGALYRNTGDVVIVNSTFNNNSASNRGGVLYQAGGVITILNSTFTNNTATNSGDDIFHSGGTLKLANNIFNTDARIIDNILRINHIFNDTLNATVTIDDNINFDVNIIANNTDNYCILDLINFTGTHKLNINFNTVGSNVYKNLEMSFYIEEISVIYVSPRGSGDGTRYSPTSLTDALNKVKIGGTIILLDGNYYNILNTVISKSVTLQGSGNTVINANSQNRMFNITASNVVVENIKFINGKTVNGSAIYWIGDNGVLKDCIFTSNAATGYGSVYWTGDNGTVKNNNFTNNTANNVGIDIYNNNTDLTITNNNFYGFYLLINNAYGAGDDIVVVVKINSLNSGDTGGVGVVVSLDENSNYDSFTLTDELSKSITLSNIESGEHKINITITDTFNTYYNIMSSFTVFDMDKVYVEPFGDGDGSEGNPTNFANALTMVNNHGTIVLGSGTYYEIMNQQINKSVSIVGESYGDVIIDGSGKYEIFTVIANDVLLENITFTNAYVDSSIYVHYGSGTVGLYGNNTKVNNCIFKNNKATSINAAVGIHVMGTNNNISNCVFEKNTGVHYGVIMAYINAENYGGANNKMYVTFDHCNFTENKLTGSISAICTYFNAVIDYCNFNNNSCNNGGTVELRATGTLSNCNFNNNHANSNGGAIYVNGVYSVLNCNFTNNSANYGGAIYVVTNTLTLKNSIFLNNTATTMGDDIYRGGGGISSSSTNNIFKSDARLIGNVL